MAIIEAAGWSLDKGHGYAPLLTFCGFSYLMALLLVQFLVPQIVLAETRSTTKQIAFH